MVDIGTAFLRGAQAFLNSRLGHMSATTWNDTGPLLGSIVTFDTTAREAALAELKADIDAMEPIANEIGKKIKKQTELISKMVKESEQDLDDDDFGLDQAARVSIRIGMVLTAADEAYAIIATELAKDAGGAVDPAVRDGLMDLWKPWSQPFEDAGAGAQNKLDQLGRLVGFDDLVSDLGKVLSLDREDDGFRLVAKLDKSGQVHLGAITLDQVSFEAFLQFSDRQVADPTEEEKKSLVQRGDKWFIGDVAIGGLRLRTILQPGLTNDPLLAKVMPGSTDPKSTTRTAISLDTAQGLYLGDGRGNERAVLPVRFSFPGVELREMAFGLVRNPAREVTAFEITTSIAAKLGSAVGMQVVGAGFVVTPEGVVEQQAVFDLPVSPRWPDAIGLRIKAGPITGGGFLEREERTYKVGGQDVKRVEFGGVLQLQVLKAGVSADRDPLARPVLARARDGHPLPRRGRARASASRWNGIGGILAIDRGLDLDELRSGMEEHIIDRVLFPEDPVSEAPKLLEKVAHVFPARDGGFVVGPIVELGWGSQAKFVELKLGVVLALPDPAVVILGALRVRPPVKDAPITDLRADLFVAITPDHLLVFASLRDSKIAGFTVEGDLGLYVQWAGEGGFELSVGGFHPEYTKLTGRAPQARRAGPAQDRPVAVDVDHLRDQGLLRRHRRLGPARHRRPLHRRLLGHRGQGLGHARHDLHLVAAVRLQGHARGGRRGRAARLHLLLDHAPRLAGGHAPVPPRRPRQGRRLVPADLRRGRRPDHLGRRPGSGAPGGQRAGARRRRPARARAWSATLPAHASQMVTLAGVEDVEGRIAHPMAGLEVSQTQVPLGVRISHLGASPVTADMVTLGAPTSTTSGEAAAVSELRMPFAVGHFFDLDGEKLLARSGFEQLPGGCRIAAATTPRLGATASERVAYRTYVRNEDDRSRPDLRDDLVFASFAGRYAAQSVVGRRVQEAGNPYLRHAPVTGPVVDVAAQGSSVVSDAFTGTALDALGGLGLLSGTEASLVTDALQAAGVAATRTTARG